MNSILSHPSDTPTLFAFPSHHHKSQTLSPLIFFAMHARPASSFRRSGARESPLLVPQENDLNPSRPAADQDPYGENRRSSHSSIINPTGQYLCDKQTNACLQQGHRTAAVYRAQNSASGSGVNAPQLPRSNARAGIIRFLKGLSSFGTWRKAKIGSEYWSGKIMDDERVGSSDHSPLIGDVPSVYGTVEASTRNDQLTDAAALVGGEATTWQAEAKLLGRSSRSLIVTFLLQYSLLVTSIFAVGHLGRSELAAVSLATSTSALLRIFICFPGLT